MPQVVEHTIYKFEELSDQAKERARDWWREGALDYDWWDFVYEDAERMGKLLGIELAQKPVKLMSGKTRYDPCIYFSGFYSQGDGACFEGSYSYAKGAAKAIRKETGNTDHKLASIADRLQAIQRRYFYKLEAKVKQSGRYNHEFSTDIDVWISDKDEYDNGAPEDAAEEVSDCLRDFMRWIYGQLRAEYEYQMADEQVDESITINEYTFDEDGRRAD